MKWVVEYHEEFYEETKEFSLKVREELVVKAKLLEEVGSQLGRPYVDTLKGSRYTNMKELRFRVDAGLWRVAFAFDPKRRAILLVAGDKGGKDQKKFYGTLIKIADRRFGDHLKRLRE